MAALTPFSPIVGTGANGSITGSGSSQSITLSTTSNQVRVAVVGTVAAAVTWGQGSATATLAGNVTVPAGQTEIFTCAPGVDTFAAICSGAGSVIYFNRGEGA